MTSKRPSIPQPTSKKLPPHNQIPQANHSADELLQLHRTALDVISRRNTLSIDPKTILNLQGKIGNHHVLRLLGRAPSPPSNRIQRGKITEEIQGSSTQGELTHTDSEESFLPLGGEQTGKRVIGRILVLVEVPLEGRGKGIGSSLVAEFLRRFGKEQCYLEVSPTQSETRSPEQLMTWYTQRGFVDTGLKNLANEAIMTNNLNGVRIVPMPPVEESEESDGENDQALSGRTLRLEDLYSDSEEQGERQEQTGGLAQDEVLDTTTIGEPEKKRRRLEIAPDEESESKDRDQVESEGEKEEDGLAKLLADYEEL